MNVTSSPIGFYVRHSSGRMTGSLRSADAPAWEIRRQAIQTSEEGGIKLVDQVLATGLTLRSAWAAMVSIATPRKENPQ